MYTHVVCHAFFMIFFFAFAHPGEVYLVRDGDTVFKGQKDLEKELGIHVRVAALRDARISWMRVSRTYLLHTGFPLCSFQIGPSVFLRNCEGPSALLLVASSLDGIRI